MSDTSFGFRLRRTVPYRRVVDGDRYSVGINDMRADPATVVVGVTHERHGRRYELAVGDVLEIGSEHWRVIEIEVGDRGTVDFAPASNAGQNGATE